MIEGLNLFHWNMLLKAYVNHELNCKSQTSKMVMHIYLIDIDKRKSNSFIFLRELKESLTNILFDYFINYVSIKII